jgi:seryl-tRNA synthetase
MFADSRGHYFQKINRVQACTDSRGHYFQKIERVQACTDSRGHYFQKIERVQACTDARGHYSTFNTFYKFTEIFRTHCINQGSVK